jgi:hypothetical protein
VNAAVRVVGLHRGREVDALLDLGIADDALVFTDAARRERLRVPLDAVDGWRATRGHVALYLRDGDVLEVDAPDDDVRHRLRLALDAVARAPEFARSLRALGGAAEADQPLHDRWFGPLLHARRALEGVTDPLRQASLLDADTLGAVWTGTLMTLAAERTGGHPARTRALEAILEEATGPVREALARVALAADRLQGSAEDTRLADWRAWVGEVRQLFAAADAAWPGLVGALRAGV